MRKRGKVDHEEILHLDDEEQEEEEFLDEQNEEKEKEKEKEKKERRGKDEEKEEKSYEESNYQQNAKHEGTEREDGVELEKEGQVKELIVEKLKRITEKMKREVERRFNQKAMQILVWSEGLIEKAVEGEIDKEALGKVVEFWRGDLDRDELKNELMALS